MLLTVFLLVIVIVFPLLPAYFLFKVLKSDGMIESENSKIRWQFSGAAAIYLLIYGTLLYKLMPGDDTVYTVHGKVVLSDGGDIGKLRKTLKFRQYPRRDQILPDGSFSAQIIKQPFTSPKMAISLPGYWPTVIDLNDYIDDDSILSFGKKAYIIVIDDVEMEKRKDEIEE